MAEEPKPQPQQPQRSLDLVAIGTWVLELAQRREKGEAFSADLERALESMQGMLLVLNDALPQMAQKTQQVGFLERVLKAMAKKRGGKVFVDLKTMKDLPAKAELRITKQDGMYCFELVGGGIVLAFGNGTPQGG